jgi:hypothetical protein
MSIAAFIHRLLGRSDIHIGPTIYMRRWRFLSFRRLPGVRLHNIMRSDADRELHDHPFTFLSIILAGGYFEHRADGTRTWYGPGSFVYRTAETLHRLELRDERAAWTLVLRGPIRRQWGFMCPTGWVHWKDFVAERYRVPTREHAPFEAPSSI